MDYTASRIEAHVDAVVSARPPAEVFERERRKLGMLLDSAAKGGLAGGGRGAVTWALVRAIDELDTAIILAEDDSPPGRTGPAVGGRALAMAAGLAFLASALGLLFVPGGTPFSSALCVLGAACFGVALGIGARNRREVRDGGQG